MKKIVSVILQAVPFLAVLAIWYYLSVLHPIPFWQISRDYSWLSLSHAFTLESKLAGVPALNHAYQIHPGLPFAITSWIALCMASFPLSDSADRIAYGIAHAEHFWMWAKAFALLLTFGGFWVVRLFFRNSTALYLLACGIYCSCLPVVFYGTLAQLSNESFSLLYVMSFQGLAYRILSAGGEGAYSPRAAPGTGIQVRPHVLLSIGLGCMAAIGWSIKIYYLAPLIGTMFGVLAALGLGIMSGREFCRFAVLAASGFIASMLFWITTFLGWKCFENWLVWNWQMLTHIGHYGSGSGGFFSLPQLLESALALARDSHWAFPVFVCSLVLLTCLAAIQEKKNRTWINSYLPFAISVLVCIGINLTGLLKHYLQDYAICIVAALPCLVFIVSRARNGMRYLLPIFVIMPVFLFITIGNAATIHLGLLTGANAVIRDFAVIDRLPLGEDQRRVWAYFSATKAGMMPHISNYASSKLATEVIRRVMPSADVSPLSDLEVNNWRYILFPKEYYPTRESISKNYRDMFDFTGTRFAPSPNDKIIELERFFVLERAIELQ